MKCDLACTGQVSLDITFRRLDALPGLGQEILSEGLVLSPGGPGVIAIVASRLGLNSVLVSPRGSDLIAGLLAEILSAEGVRWEGPAVPQNMVTVILPIHQDRAMITTAPDFPMMEETFRRVEPRAATVHMTDLALVPDTWRVYAVTNHTESTRWAGNVPEALRRARALIANEDEALRLTAETNVESAALLLASRVETAVVTLGRRGAIAARDGSVVRAPAADVSVVDTTGAGDLFTASFIWADLSGFSLQRCLELATIYASRSVQVYSGMAGAMTRRQLEDVVGPLA
jgi:sugar/nucleoside kinase (ribokinase family)